jgi:transcriptional regulator with XRE-family HTH domain
MSIKDKERREKQQWLKAFGAHIKKMRTAKGISEAEFARLLFIDQPNLTRLEKGRTNPSVYLIKRICDVLEISMAKFFSDF